MPALTPMQYETWLSLDDEAAVAFLTALHLNSGEEWTDEDSEGD